MRIPSQNLLKGNLVGDARLVIPLRPVGKGHFPAALEVSGDLSIPLGILHDALRGEHQIVVDGVALQNRKTPAAARHIHERCALIGQRQYRLFQHVDAVLCAAYLVPLKPVVHGLPPP